MAAAKVEAVQLVNETQPGLVFPHKFDIEDEWKDLHVAVIGIMGDEKSGKSFLMNLIAEYLRCEDSGTGGWMNNLKKGKTKVSGFEIRKIENIANSNEGLYIWPRPFIIKRPADEKKIAVILLDLNMKDASPSMELTLSLLCSTIIYNTNSNDVSKLCHLIETIKQSRQEICYEDTTSSLNDLLFEHMIILFRDQQTKCGEDKDLNHLKSVIKENRIIDVTEQSNIDSFLLPRPKQGPVNEQDHLDIDKTFSQYITSLINKKLTIDDLHLKSCGGHPITVNKFFSILQFICSFVAFPLFQEFTSGAESSTAEPMETNSEDANAFLYNDDVEMKGVENQEKKISLDNSKTPCLVPHQHLTQEKLNEEDIPNDENITAICTESQSSKNTRKAKATTNQEQNVSSNSHSNCNGGGTMQNNSVSNEEIDNKIEKFEKSVRNKAKRFFESQQCTPEQVQNEFERIHATTKKKFEEFCCTHAIKNPVRIISKFENRILTILEELKKNTNEKDDAKKEKIPAPSKPTDVPHVSESHGEGTKQNNYVTDKEIDKKIEKIEKSVRIRAKLFFESQCTPEQIQNEVKRIYKTAKKEFEEFGSTHTNKNPDRMLSIFDKRILNILEELENNANGRDDGKKEKFPAPSKPKGVSNVIKSQLELYNESMKHLLSTNTSISKKTLAGKHANLMEMVMSAIMQVCKEENLLLDDILPLILPQLEQVYKSYQKRVGPVDDFTPRTEAVEPFLDKSFIHECKQRLQSETFFETGTSEIVNSTINNSIQEVLAKSPNFSREQIEKSIRKSSTMTKYSKIAESCKATLNLYTLEMNKKQKMYNFLSPEQISKFHSDAIKKRVLSAENAENKEILDSGFQVLEEQYQALNEDIIRNEQHTFFQTIIPETNILYEKEMKYFIEKKKPTAAQMTEEHEKLKNQCKAAIVKACSYKDPNLPLLQNCFDQMNQELDKQLQNVMKTNPFIVADLQNKIQAAVNKAHLEYNNAMKMFMKGQTYSASELENLHKECLRKATAVMKLDIRSIDKNEDPQSYIRKLQMKTENDLKELYRIGKSIQEKNKFERPITRSATEDEKARRHEKWKNEQFNPDLAYDFNTHSKTNETASPILAIEFGLHTIKTGVIINAAFKYVPNRLGESEFPNLVAITKQGEVLVGNEVQYRCADISYTFHPGNLMRLPSNEVIAHHSEKIQFQGHTILATKEFLCGLILSRIKKDSEEILKQPISRVVITVPLWYTSSQRQATKDAGIIAGFESVNLINDITAAALAYAKEPCNRNRYHDVLIINAIAGNVDVAVYEMGNGKIKMKTCAGFLHGQSNFEAPWIVKQMAEIWRMLWHGNTPASGNEAAAVTKLVEHCVKNRYIPVSTVLFDGDIESKYKYLEDLKYIATRRERQYIEIEGAILKGAAIFADLLKRNLDYVAKSSKSDLLPYQIDFVRPNSTHGKIFERHIVLSSNEQKQDFTFPSKGDVGVEIMEIGNSDNIKTGFLHIPCKEFGIQYNEVTAFISSEGILRFTAKHRYGAGKTIDVLWKSYNLTQEEIAKYASLISSYYPTPEQLKKLQGWKADLRQLAHTLSYYSKKVASGLGKERISVVVQEAYKEADAAYTTQERIEKITNDLAELKSKYCPNM